MPENKDDMGIKDKIHIVLRGPDGEIKQEIKQEPVIVTEDGDVYAEDGTFIKNIKDEEK